jgi:outer membrane protein assembly factor BamB
MLRNAALWFQMPLEVLVSVAALASIDFAQPAVTVTPKTGPPTDRIATSGSGFSPEEAVDVYFDTAELALATTNSSGAFTDIGLTVPASAIPGTHWVTAVERHSGLAAQTRFIVQTDWPQFRRGPQHHGDDPTENILSISNVHGLQQRWSAATAGNYGASPTVANGIVYIGSLDHNLYAFNAATGQALWKAATGGEVTSSVVGKGLVYAGSDKVYAFDAATGQPVWNSSTGGVAYFPVLAGGVLYVASDRLYALNAASGQTLWVAAIGGFIDGSLAVGNGIVYVVANGLQAFDATAGQLMWRAPYGGYDSPTVGNGIVYIGSTDGTLYALNAATGQLIWSAPTGGEVNSSPALAAGVVYVGSDDFKLHAYNAATGQPLWNAATGGNIESSPAVANGVVYSGSDDGRLYAFDALTGQNLWSAITSNQIYYSSPAVANGIVYVGNYDGNLYAYSLPLPQALVRPDPAMLKRDPALKPQQP